MNLLITGAWNNADDYLNIIKESGHNVCFHQYEKDDLPCSYEWVEGIICNGLFLFHPIEKFENLQYIQLTSAGYDRVPMEYIKEHNIEIHNAHGVYSIPMAEYAVTGVLDIYKQMGYFRENQKEAKWEKHRGMIELFGKTVCIIGCGSVGTECAKRFRAFDCKVIGISRSTREDENYFKIVDMNHLEENLSMADVVVLAIPLTKETKYLLNEDRLDLLKDDTILVNISRGTVVEEEALVKHLKRLRGAVLDVFEEEPLKQTSPLWTMKNVIITPHNCFVGDNNAKRLANVIMNNLGMVQ